MVGTVSGTAPRGSASRRKPQGLLFALLKVRRGDGAALERDAREDVSRITDYVFRVVDLPPGVGFEDVRQEVLIALWRSTLKWDPTRGTRLVTHAMWNAITSARKWCHSQRQCLGKRDSKEPSRYPLNFGRLVREDAEGEPTVLSAIESDGGAGARVTEAVAHYRELLSLLDPGESALVEVIVSAAGDVRKAAELAAADPVVRKIARIRRFEDALVKVQAAALRLQAA